MAMCAQGPGWSLEGHASPPSSREHWDTRQSRAQAGGCRWVFSVNSTRRLPKWTSVLSHRGWCGQLGDVPKLMSKHHSLLPHWHYASMDTICPSSRFSFLSKVSDTNICSVRTPCARKRSWGIHILAHPWGPICNPPGTPSDLAKWVAVLPPAKLTLSSWSQSPAYNRDQTAEGKSGFSVMATGWIQFIWWGTF